MLKVGITGNIGAGKTTVSRLFGLLGIPVIYADPLAKRLMSQRLDLRSSLIDVLGSAVYFADGSLNKPLVADLIFSDDRKRDAVNQLVHKAVSDHIQVWFDNQKSSYAIEEAALIYESGSHHYLDTIIVVDAPYEVRKQRVLMRDEMKEEEFLSREKAQLAALEKVKRADFVIVNDNSHGLIKQVYKIHRTLVHISNQQQL